MLKFREEIVNMECPYCGEELTCDDYYGIGNPMRNDFKKLGDIYKCQNEKCEMYQEHFYTRNNEDELHEGYPC